MEKFRRLRLPENLSGKLAVFGGGVALSAIGIVTGAATINEVRANPE